VKCSFSVRARREEKFGGYSIPDFYVIMGKASDFNIFFEITKNAIPLIREVQEGIPVVDENGNRIGESKVAAKTGITAVTLSRILMASPGMST
jgi:K+/H+ antiporter YhaU regulatory subunit KhtT